MNYKISSKIHPLSFGNLPSMGQSTGQFEHKKTRDEIRYNRFPASEGEIRICPFWLLTGLGLT